MSSDSFAISPAGEREYVLGTGVDELERLALQHRFWSDAAHAAWRLAKIKIGQRVLDVGCGPGFASFDLAQLVTRQGVVTGVDESRAFVEHANRQAHVRGLPQLSAIVGDVQEINAAIGDQRQFDLAYARWVLCFVPNPEQVVKGVAKSLAPGGKFVIHDYFHYETLTAAPKQPAHDRAVAATIRSWKSRGGNTDIVGELPRILESNGFTVEHMSVHARMARPDETMFQWPLIWWRIYAPKLVAMDYLSQVDCDQLLADFEAMQSRTDCFVQCPLVYELIAKLQR